MGNLDNSNRLTNPDVGGHEMRSVHSVLRLPHSHPDLPVREPVVMRMTRGSKGYVVYVRGEIPPEYKNRQ